MKKGQIGVEAVVMIGVMLALVAIIVSYNYNKVQEQIVFEKNSKLEIECQRLSGIVSKVYSSKNETSWNGHTDYNVFFAAEAIEITDDNKTVNACIHSADLNNSNFWKKGSIKFRKTKEQVRIE